MTHNFEHLETILASFESDSRTGRFTPLAVTFIKFFYRNSTQNIVPIRYNQKKKLARKNWESIQRNITQRQIRNRANVKEKKILGCVEKSIT